MNAYVFTPSDELIGKFEVSSAEELSSAFAAFRATEPAMRAYSYIQAAGKVWTVTNLDPIQLREGRVAAESAQAEKVSATGTLRHPSGGGRSVMTRYTDAYLLARAVTGVGITVKIISFVIGGAIALIGATLGSKSVPLGIGGFLIGVGIGVPIYVLGVLVSAQGQILKAALDSAVYTSPFLNEDQMKQIMSLD